MLVDAKWLAEQLSGASGRDIAQSVTAMIRAGTIPVGSRLPTVRDLAELLGLSPATVSTAWGELRRRTIISGQGRSGVWVCGDDAVQRPVRYESSGNLPAGVLNLSRAVPDPALLPPLEEALVFGASQKTLNTYVRTRITEPLANAVSGIWPYRAESFLATNGGFEAVYSTLMALVLPGSVVAIENPTAMRLLDMLENLRARIIPVEADEHGPKPGSLREALASKPVAFIYQPRTHTVTGNALDPLRLKELGSVLKASDLLIVEDDGIGALSRIAPQSLGATFPDRTIHIQSFSKAYGPDLRVAVLSGPAKLVGQIQAFRSFGAGWTSRVLQDATAWLLGDETTARTVEQARQVYNQRRDNLAAALKDRGLTLPDSDGLCLWIPVRSEQYALVTLAARGVGVLPGRKCSLVPGDYVRVATGLLADGYEALAASLVLASADPGEEHLDSEASV